MAIRQPSRSGCPSPTRRCGDGDLGPRVEPLGSREGTRQLGKGRKAGLLADYWRITRTNDCCPHGAEPQCHRKAPSFEFHLDNDRRLDKRSPAARSGSWPRCPSRSKHRLGISPIAILLPNPFLQGRSGACLAAHVLSFFKLSAWDCLLPLLGCMRRCLHWIGPLLSQPPLDICDAD